jgi:hypothetical protein
MRYQSSSNPLALRLVVVILGKLTSSSLMI